MDRLLPVEMRLDAEWMTRADGRILELLAEAGPMTPSELAADERLRFTAQHVGNRLRQFLEPYGLVRSGGTGDYEITDTGRRYLEGEIDADELEPAHL